MGFNSHIDFELHDAIQDLVDEGLLEEDTPAHGIAKQVVEQGYESLSDKQRRVFDTVVTPALDKRTEELRIRQIVDNADP